MNTINNTAIVEAKAKLLKTVNEILQTGMPMSIVDLMMESISGEIKMSLQNQLKREAEQQTAQEKVQAEQIEWVQEDTN